MVLEKLVLGSIILAGGIDPWSYSPLRIGRTLLAETLMNAAPVQQVYASDRLPTVVFSNSRQYDGIVPTACHMVHESGPHGPLKALDRCLTQLDRWLLARPEHLLIVPGDQPLLRPSTLLSLVQQHLKCGNDVTTLAVDVSVAPNDTHLRTLTAEWGRLVIEDEKLTAISGLDLGGLTPSVADGNEVAKLLLGSPLRSLGVFIFRTEAFIPLLCAEIDKSPGWIERLVQPAHRAGHNVGYQLLTDYREAVSVRNNLTLNLAQTWHKEFRLENEAA